MIPTVICLDFGTGPWRVEAERLLELPCVPAVSTTIHLPSVTVKVTAVEYWLGEKQYVLRASLIRSHWGSNLPASNDPLHLQAVMSTLKSAKFEEMTVWRNGHPVRVWDSNDGGKIE